MANHKEPKTLAQSLAQLLAVLPSKERGYYQPESKRK